MKPKNTICLWFNKNTHEAAQFYASNFPESQVTTVRYAPRDFPGGKQGDILTVEFTVMGIPCLGPNGGQEETDRYGNAIVSNGGAERACGWCKDRWGMSGQITPRVLIAAMAAQLWARRGSGLPSLIELLGEDIPA